jgi:hypothetical protein
MLLVTLTSWILFLKYGLAFESSPSFTSYTNDELEECLGQTSTSSFLPVATIEVKSEYLNLSVAVQVASITVVASSTVQIALNSSKSDYYQPITKPLSLTQISSPTVQIASNRSKSDDCQPTTKPLSTNQTSNRTDVSSAKVIISPMMASNPSSSSSSLAVSSLIFDHNPSLPLLPTSVTNTSALTSSGSYLGSSDTLFLLLISAIQMGIV